MFSSPDNTMLLIPTPGILFLPFIPRSLSSCLLPADNHLWLHSLCFFLKIKGDWNCLISLVLSLPCYQESLSILKCMWSFRVRCTHDWDSSTNCCLQIQPHPTSVMQHFWEVKAACWICQGWVKSLSEIYLFLF